MAKQSIVGIFKDRIDAENFVTALKSAGRPDNDISVLFPDKAGTKDFAHNNSTKAPEGATAGGVTGGVIGGALGLLAGIGALAIPGVGPLIAAGPIMATLSGAAVGAAAGSLSGALIGMGIPEYEAKMYEGKILEGNILIAVHADDGDDSKNLEKVFKDYNATDIHRVDQVHVKK